MQRRNTRKKRSLNKVITLRCTPEQHDAIAHNAASTGLTLSNYVRRASLGKRPRTKAHFMQSLTLYHFSRLAVQLDNFIDECRAGNLQPPKATNDVRALVQQCIETMTADDSQSH